MRKTMLAAKPTLLQPKTHIAPKRPVVTSALYTNKILEL